MLQFLALKPETFALDISDLSLKIIKLRKKRGFLSLVSFGETEIKPGIIEGGEIKDQEALAKIIKEAILKVKGEKLKTRYVICSLPEEKSFLEVIQMPKIPDEELAKAIRFEAENYIPLPFNEVYLDFQRVRPIFNHLDHTDVLFAALPKKVVDPYVVCLKKAGLIPLVLEAESQAISRAIVKEELSPFPVLIIDFGATRTGFVIFSGYSLRFTSPIPVSSQNLTQALASHFNIDLPEAEKLKRKYGLENRVKIELGKEEGRANPQQGVVANKEVFDTLLPSIIQLVGQIQKHLDYYQTHSSHEHLSAKKDAFQGAVKKVFLCGGGANLKGLTDIMSLELRIPVETGNPWANVLPDPLKEVPGLPYQESLRYTTAIGLALRGVKEDS